MRHTVVLAVMIVGFMTSYSNAQMGHGMMRDGHMMGSDEQMMGQREQPMEHGKMMGDMKGMTQDITDLMRRISELMASDISRKRAHALSDVVRDMAAEMNRISFIMDRGAATEDEMKDVRNRMMKIQEDMAAIKN